MLDAELFLHPQTAFHREHNCILSKSGHLA